MLKIALLIFLSFNPSQYERAFYENPTSRNPVFNTLIAYYRSHGNYNKILEITGFGLRRHPDDWKLAKYYTEALLKSGRKDSARVFADTYLKRKLPAQAYRDFYGIFYFSYDRQFALQILRKAREIYHSDTLFAREFYYDNLWNKNFEGALYELFNFYLQTHSMTLLRQEFSRIERFLDEKTIQSTIDKWLRRHPGHPEVRIVLADYYMRHNRPELMVQELERSGWTKDISSYVKYLISAGLVDRANSLLDKVQKKDGHYYFLKGIVLSKLGAKQKAINFYKKAASKFNIKEARDSLLSLAFKIGDYKTVLKFSNRNNLEIRLKALLALEEDSAFVKEATSNPSDVSFYFLGLYYFLIGKPDSSSEYWNRLLTRYPQSFFAHQVFFYREIMDNFKKGKVIKVFFLVDSLIMRRDLETARLIIKKEIPSDSTGLLRFELAKIYEEQGKINEAYSEFSKAGDETSTFISPFSYFRAYFIALRKLHDRDLAESVARKLINRYPESPYAAAMRAIL